MHVSDEELLETIARNPPEGIRLVMDAYSRILLGRLRRRALACEFGDAHVEDVLQEAIVSLVDPKTRQAIRAAGGSILPWLTRRGYWRLQDEHRRDLRSFAVQVADPPPGTTEPSEIVLAVERLLLEMSERDQQILRQHYGEDMTYAQIAEAVGISKEAAKKAIHDAKARLRKRLADAGYGIEGATDVRRNRSSR